MSVSSGNRTSEMWYASCQCLGLRQHGRRAPGDVVKEWCSRRLHTDEIIAAIRRRPDAPGTISPAGAVRSTTKAFRMMSTVRPGISLPTNTTACRALLKGSLKGEGHPGAQVAGRLGPNEELGEGALEVGAVIGCRHGQLHGGVGHIRGQATSISSL